MRDETFVFFDFDNTLSDFDLLGQQYVAALARILTEECGGDPGAWAAAALPALRAGVARYVERFTGRPLAGYNDWLETERARVAEDIFSAAGQPPPSHEPLDSFARRMQFDALIACNAAFPDTSVALSALFEAGVRVQMASSQESEYLLAALMGAGIESFIECKFGPDLVDCAKEGAEFYLRVFEATGIPPERAIVVDDQVMCLEWAREAGARIVQARCKPGLTEPRMPVAFERMADLPGLIALMAGQ